VDPIKKIAPTDTPMKHSHFFVTIFIFSFSISFRW
jgi:hypothetical protein